MATISSEKIIPPDVVIGVLKKVEGRLEWAPDATGKEILREVQNLLVDLGGYPVKRLRDVLPKEAIGGEFIGKPFRKYLDYEVEFEMGGSGARAGVRRGGPFAWPGRERNVNVWWILKDKKGHAVGWNESPVKGWSFPVIVTPSHR